MLLGTGLLLGGIAVSSRRRRAHLMWFLPVLLLAAIAFALVIDDAGSVLLLGPEQLGIGVVSVAPAVAFSFALSWGLLRLRAPRWLLFGVPVVACLVSAPLAGYVAFMAVCELIGNCP